MSLIYIDESGDHAPAATNPEYPLFVIVACVFDEGDYAHRFVPRLLSFKLRHWGHDAVVLHEREIRKNQGDFAFLFDRESRAHFLSDLSLVIRSSGARVAAAVWDKRQGSRVRTYSDCLVELLLRLDGWFSLSKAEQRVVLESRGEREDREVAVALERMGESRRWRPLFVRKHRNLSGLQLADLCARPIGIKTLNPARPNRAFDETICELLRTDCNTQPLRLVVLD